MMKKEKELLVAIASQKGGVGKSVFTVLLASWTWPGGHFT